MDEVSLEFRGKRVSATLNRGQTLSGTPLSRNEPAMWYVTIGGTALTKLPALPGEDDTSVQSRILEWLEQHPDLLDRDQIVLGGG
jgi:hypothetical protein